MRRTTAALLLLLAGCAASPPPRPASTPPPAPSPPPPAPRPVDQCGAAQHQHLVGRPRTEIPVPVDPSLQRVACTTCPVTMDFNPRRLNFFFDAASGTIREVKCG